MESQEEHFSFPVFRTRDYVRSARRLVAVGADPSLVGAPEQFECVVDFDGLSLMVRDVAEARVLFATPWDHIGPLRDDWIRRDGVLPERTVGFIGFLFAAFFFRAEPSTARRFTEVGRATLIVPLALSGGTAELRLTTEESDLMVAQRGLRRRIERLRFRALQIRERRT